MVTGDECWDQLILTYPTMQCVYSRTYICGAGDSDSDQLQSGEIQTDESHSRHFLPTPPFRAQRSADLTSMAKSHPRRELCIAMLIQSTIR